MFAVWGPVCVRFPPGLRSLALLALSLHLAIPCLQLRCVCREIKPPRLPALKRTHPRSPPLQGIAPPPGYRIGAGDNLEINVWKEPEASVSECHRPA